MNIIVLEGKKMTSKQQAHAYIAETMSFPEYYGSNLDALADCLSDMPKGTTVILIDDDDMRKNMGHYADSIIDVFQSVSDEYRNFDFLLCGDIS